MQLPIIDNLLHIMLPLESEVKNMTIYVRKIGTSKRGPFCTFICDFDNGFIINGIANVDGVEVKEDTKYTDLYLEQQIFNGMVRYTLHKK